ncbi:MAG TPA: chromosome partitioning protein ParA [Pseudomonas sp.]|nr:chromosome partitioning protein ParA [Pseudomonas sp.]
MELTTMKTRIEKSPFQLRGIKLAALALGSSLVLAGCAGKPPTEQYAVTQSAVNSAVSAGGTEFAAVEMKAAQDKFKQAEIAMHDKKYDEAKILAEQAEWDARVAERKAQAMKAQKAVQDARQGVQDVREEGMRAADPMQPQP